MPFKKTEQVANATTTWHFLSIIIELFAFPNQNG